MKNSTLATLFALLVLIASASAHADPELSVMSFNIRYGSADDGPNSWEQRKQTVANTIRHYSPDIVGTQECLLFQAQYLDEALPEYEHFGVGRKPNGTGERMQIFFKTELLAPIETGNFWLSETPEVPGSRAWDAGSRRMVTWAKFYHLKSRRFFYFMNTHLDNSSELARKEGALVIARRVKDMPEKLPMVLLGDFNSNAEAKTEPWTILTRRLFQDAWISTKNAVGPKITSSRFGPPADRVNRIDWILHRGGFSVNHCETVLFNENGRYPSDHYPVFARLIFSE